MTYLIKSAKVIAKHSDYHNQVVDILIDKGRIAKIAKRISEKDARIIESENLHVSIGWFDIGTHVGEPGFEQRETLKSLDKVAACGGYTGVAIFPETDPVIQRKYDIQHILTATSNFITDILPIAALSHDCAGNEMTEMIDLHEAGAVAFSDGLNAIQNDGLLERSLEYAKGFKGKIIHSPHNTDRGQIHEGAVSIQVGLPGIPEHLEKAYVERDLNLVAYTDSNLILHGISSHLSLDLIKASDSSKKISTTVPYLNLVETDEALLEFDENFKVKPPLRDEKNQEELIKYVRTRQVDAIISNHVPFEIESKQDAFPFASFGASGLQTCFAGLNTIPRTKLPLEILVDKISVGPRELLGLKVPKIETKAKANLTLFDPGIEWVLDEETNQSISLNNPYFGQSLKGKVIAVFNNKKMYSTPY